MSFRSSGPLWTVTPYVQDPSRIGCERPATTAKSRKAPFGSCRCPRTPKQRRGGQHIARQGAAPALSVPHGRLDSAMRPSRIDPLSRAHQPERCRPNRKVFMRGSRHRGAPRVIDLIFHLPHTIIDRRARRPWPSRARPIVTGRVLIEKPGPPRPQGSRALSGLASDETGDVTRRLVHCHRSARADVPGRRTRLLGRIESSTGMRQRSSRPVLTAEQAASMPMN